MHRKRAEIQLPMAWVAVFLKQVRFFQKPLLEDVSGIEAGVATYFLPILNFSCHFRLVLPPASDGRVSEDVGS